VLEQDASPTIKLETPAQYRKEGGALNRRSQKKRDRFAEIDQILREISHQALCHCGDNTLDETITRDVMDGVEKLTTSSRLKRALGPNGKRKCPDCEAGWTQKLSTKNTGPVHKTPPKGPGTDISADVVGPMPRSINGYTLFLIIICLQTKFIYIVGLKEQSDMHIKLREYMALIKRADVKH
jgi:hypothetical protein